MSVRVVCEDCGTVHAIPDRPDTETGATVCPECGSRPYAVRREGLGWHPEP